jgi:tRNA pseudouridine38-40 synthase
VPPFLCRYVQQNYGALNFDAMAEAARKFEGEHDFTTFSASTGSEEEDRERPTTRVIYRSELLRISYDDVPGAPEEWVYQVRGKSFLRYMVRKITGALVDVGCGKIQPDDIPRLLEMRDRAKSGPTMPPHGLCLLKVEYPEVEFPPAP